MPCARASARSLRHGGFVGLVGAGVGDAHDRERKAGRLGLRLEQRAPHRVHRHAVVGLVERGEEPHDLHVLLLAQNVEGEGAVLAAAPGEQASFTSPRCGSAGRRGPTRPSAG